MSILNACKESKYKFEEIKDISKQLLEISKKTTLKIDEIGRIYSIVFNNFNPSRERTGIFIEGEYNKQEVCLNTKGISLMYEHAEKSDYIDNRTGYIFMKILGQIKSKENEILAHIIKEEKRKVFTDFLENLNTIKKSPRTKVMLNTPWKIENYQDAQTEIICLDIGNDNLLLLQKKGEDSKFINEIYNYSRGLKVNMINQSLVDKFLIDQMYDELKPILLNVLKEEEENLKAVDSFIENLKVKFGRQLIVNSLDKKNERR